MYIKIVGFTPISLLYMDKIRFLKYLSKSSCFPLLTENELKLYILLLLTTKNKDISGKIKVEQIEKACGKRLNFIEVKSMMDSLDIYKLAVMEGFIEHGGKYGEMRFRLQKPLSMRQYMSHL